MSKEENHTAVVDVEKEARARSASPESIDPAAERRLLWKLDYTIYPVLFVVFMMSFLDRINISNARIQGLTGDLNLVGNRFNIALFVYFVPYVLLEVPSNMLIRKTRPSYYLGGLMFCWGIVNMCMGFVQTFEALVALRFLLGIFEAGVFPGMIYLTSMYYKRHEYQKRMSTLFCSTLIGGAFGGLLAYAIANLGGHLGYAAWRWIFIIEGAITAFIALIAAALIVDWPERCQYLTAEEKDLVRRRLEADVGDVCRMDTLNNFAYKLILTDYKIWLSSLIYMGVGTTGYAITFFMPTILSELGWQAQAAQWHTIPCYVVAAAGLLIAAYLSDRTKHRYGFIMTGVAIASTGYIMLLNQGSLSRDAKYAAVFLVTLGGYMATPIPLGWLANNTSGHWKRAFGSGFQVMIGNCAGLVGSNIFLTNESPSYPTGYGTAFGMLLMGALAATIQEVLLWRDNKQRAAGKQDWKLRLPEEEIKNMGDYHPSFRFTL
ncbi:MFS general substrate transporter [Thozetella sp. PMI_491]|nr:MFS general substrate transporter [Thozetella sp. PMI_491]